MAIVNMDDVRKRSKDVATDNNDGSQCVWLASESYRGPWTMTWSESGSVGSAKETQKAMWND